MRVHNLFPTPVVIFKLDKGLPKEELNFLLNLKTKPNQGNKLSFDDKVLKHREMFELKNYIEKCLHEYFVSVHAPNKPVKPYITQSWVNYTTKDQFHHKHAHPNSFISGVFYIKSDKKKDKIHFFKDGYAQIKLTTDNYNLYNSDSWWLEVEENSLILFPSSLTHAVEKIETDLRVSLSFNTFLKGNFGDSENMTGLRLEN